MFGTCMFQQHIRSSLVESEFVRWDQISLKCRQHAQKEMLHQIFTVPEYSHIKGHNIVTISGQWLDIKGYQDSRHSFLLANNEFGYRHTCTCKCTRNTHWCTCKLKGINHRSYVSLHGIWILLSAAAWAQEQYQEHTDQEWPPDEHTLAINPICNKNNNNILYLEQFKTFKTASIVMTKGVKMTYPWQLSLKHYTIKQEYCYMTIAMDKSSRSDKENYVTS